MRILVTGGQGQVGSELEALGLGRGLDLVALGRSELDATNASSIAAAFEKYKPGMLINAAAYTAVDKAESESDLAFALNETAPALLADACVKARIPMLHISTDYVFDGSKEEPYDEKDSVNPLAVYAKSKEAGERAVRKRMEQHIILRTSWVFGIHGNNFVKTIVRLARDRDRLTVVADQYGGPSSARGIAKALLTIATYHEKGVQVDWGTYHYCQKPYVSWHQFSNEIVAGAIEKGLVDHSVVVAPILSSEFVTPVKRPSNSCLKTDKLERNFKIATGKWALELEAVLDNLKENI